MLTDLDDAACGPARALVCTAEVGCGHTRAATAVALAMREVWPEADTRIADVLESAPGWFTRPYRDGYLRLARHAPRITGWMYNRADGAGAGPAGGALGVAVERRALRGFLGSRRVCGATVLVCTHFLAARVLSGAKAEGSLSAGLCVVVTDQHPHAVWRVPNADLFIVGSEVGARTLRACGVDTDRVLVAGIPIDRRFGSGVGKAGARARHGLGGQGRKVVLICGGGLGLGGLDRALEGFLASGTGAHAVVVCGHNAALRATLEQRMRGHPQRSRVTVLGVTHRMHELMEAADVLVGKPGGLTSAEAMAVGLPMVMLRPIPGQEERNADLLIGVGAACLVPDPFAAGRRGAELVFEEETLAAMTARAREIGRPRSAYTAACAIRKRWAVELPNRRSGSAGRGELALTV